MGIKSYWLDGPDGRLMISHWAVLMGRSPDCNVVLVGPEFSRHHLLVRVGPSGAELLPLGRRSVRVNGAACQALTPLKAGDRIELGRWTFQLGAGDIELAQEHEAAWFLERSSGLLHPITGQRFDVGGDAVDHLQVSGWEPTVFSLHVSGESLTLTARRAGVACERLLAVGERVAVTDPTRIHYRSEALTVRARPAQALDETLGAERPKFAVLVMLEFMPRGAQLTIEIAGRLHTTQLSEKRSDLVACLLQPPTPYAAGDFIPEEVLCARVWPDARNGGLELNSLVYRLRQSLTDEGIDPSPLLERRGGGLRFCLAPRARVVVR